MQKWEYMWLCAVRGWKDDHSPEDWVNWRIAPGVNQKITGTFIDYLNQLGNQGWELVNVTSQTDYQGAYMGGFTTQQIWTLKRPIT